MAKYGFEAYVITGLIFDVFCIDFTTRSPNKIFSVKTHYLDVDTTKKTASELKDIFQIYPLTMSTKDYGSKLE